MENVDHCGININALNGLNRTGLDLTKVRGKKFERWNFMEATRFPFCFL